MRWCCIWSCCAESWCLAGPRRLAGRSGMWIFWRARCSGWVGGGRSWPAFCGQVVGIVMELAAAEMQENQVVVVVNAPREPLMVRVDAQLMQQALLNLLLN